MKKIAVAIMSVLILSLFVFAGRFDNEKMSNFGKEVNKTLEQAKKASEIGNTSEKELIRQAREQIRKDMMNYLKGFAPESETMFYGEYYLENALDKIPQCEYTVYYLDAGYAVNHLFYQCPTQIVKRGIFFLHVKDINDYRYVKGNFNKGTILFVLGDPSGYHDGRGLNVVYPPKKHYKECEDDAIYFFKEIKDDIEQKPDLKIPLQFKKLKTWKVNDYLKDTKALCTM